ncbi:MAG: hypothetical protein KAT77_03060 [Nanoarchaeota archaeon]|nr:hypothetical protein [Nanoarchaeota archaeon]
MKDYLTLSEKQGKGYLDILKAFRTPIPLGTQKHHANIEFQVDGEIPQEIHDELPIFGLPFAAGEVKYSLNSGGRGILLSDGKRHVRFKGSDLDGSITARVAKSKNNHIHDVKEVYESREGLGAVVRPNGVYELFSHEGKPFSFFLQNSVDNEKRASEVIAKGFEKAGFFAPYRQIASITYPNIQWQGQETSTLVFELPSLESDLRYQEFDRHAFLHLKFASPEQLKELEEEFCSFLEKLTTWYAFANRIMVDNRLVPTEASHHDQNYVICHVADGMIGAARVDHTSTKKTDKHQIKKYKKHIQKDIWFFATIGGILKQGIDLADQGFRFDSNFYTGYFDQAYKWKQPWTIGDFPKQDSYNQEMQKFFNRGWNKEPIPIPEQDLVSLVNKISAVEQDLELQARVRANQERMLGPNKDKLLDLLIKHIAENGGDISKLLEPPNQD